MSERRNPVVGFAWLSLAALMAYVVVANAPPEPIREIPAEHYISLAAEVIDEPVPETPPTGGAQFPILTTVDAESGEPVRWAKVYERASEGYRDLGKTDENGRLPLPLNGTGSLLIQRQGYSAAHVHGGVQNRTVKLKRIPPGFV